MNYLPAVIVLLLPSLLSGQTSYGQGQLIFRGSYLARSGQNFTGITGAGFRFNTFLPHVGMLSASLDNYSMRGGLGLGENYLRLSGVAWGKRHWDFGGGDFSVPLASDDYPLTHLWLPHLRLRGFRVATESKNRRYEIFGGSQTIFHGFRVPLRVSTPQQILGASLRQTLSEGWTASLRFLEFSTAPDEFSNPASNLFTSLNRRFTSARSLTAQTTYKPTTKLRLFGEATLSTTKRPLSTSPVTEQPLSLTTGLAWKSERLTARASFARQSTSYLPALGLFLGDRQGPFARIRYRLSKRFSITSSASSYRNNLERNPRYPTFSRRSSSIGATADLPASLHLSAQLTDIDFTSQSPYSGNRETDNQQLILSAVQTHGPNRARLSFQNLAFNQRRAHLASHRLRSWEFEDSYRLGRRLTLGAATRFQKSFLAQHSTPEYRNSLFFRYFGSASLGRFGAHANFQHGADLINETIFATNAFNVSTAGLSARIAKRWTLRADAMRYRRTTELNPESIFILGQTATHPLVTAFPSTGQWTFFFRLSKNLRWGTAPRDTDNPMDRRVPLSGRIVGYVWNGQQEKRVPVSGITISLNGEQSAITDSKGRYVFQKVPQGARRVDLHIARLPAHYDPAGLIHQFLHVRPTETSRADFHIVSLAWFEGRVKDSEQLTLENVLVRLRPGDRYTTAESDGSFSFHNLPLGEYEASIDPSHLPGEVVILSQPTVPVNLFDRSDAPFVNFELGVRREKKRIRHIEIPDG